METQIRSTRNRKKGTVRGTITEVLGRYRNATHELQSMLAAGEWTPITSSDFTICHGVTATFLYVLVLKGIIERKRFEGARSSRSHQYRRTDKLIHLTPETALALCRQYVAANTANTGTQLEEVLTPLRIEPELPVVPAETARYAVLVGSDATWHDLSAGTTRAQALAAAEGLASQYRADCTLIRLVAKIEHRPQTTFFD